MEDYLMCNILIFNEHLVKEPERFPELMIRTIWFMEAGDNPILAIIYYVEVFTGQEKGDEIWNYLWMVPHCLLFISRYHCSKGCVNYTPIANDGHGSFHMCKLS